MLIQQKYGVDEDFILSTAQKAILISAIFLFIVFTHNNEENDSKEIARASYALPYAPQELCRSMDDYPRINPTRGWNDKAGSWGCGSDYYDLKGVYTTIPDNIAYYVMGKGDKHSAEYASIMINVNDMRNIDERYSDWVAATSYWLDKNLTTSTSSNFNAKSLPKKGEATQGVVGDYNGTKIRIEAKYEPWKNGNGATLVSRFYKAD